MTTLTQYQTQAGTPLPRIDPKSLFDLPLKVEFESLRDFHQIVKVQTTKTPQDPAFYQLVFDRIHKSNLNLSKPLGYVHAVSPKNFVDLASLCLTAAITMALTNSQDRMNKVDGVRDSFWMVIKDDVSAQAKKVLKETGSQTSLSGDE